MAVYSSVVAVEGLMRPTKRHHVTHGDHGSSQVCRTPYNGTKYIALTYMDTSICRPNLTLRTLSAYLVRTHQQQSAPPPSETTVWASAPGTAVDASKHGFMALCCLYWALATDRKRIAHQPGTIPTAFMEPRLVVHPEQWHRVARAPFSRGPIREVISCSDLIATFGSKFILLLLAYAC